MKKDLNQLYRLIRNSVLMYREQYSDKDLLHDKVIDIVYEYDKSLYLFRETAELISSMIDCAIAFC